MAATLSTAGGALLASCAVVVLARLFSGMLFSAAFRGLLCAWAASSVSVGALAFFRGAPGSVFWRVFGAGVALRAAVLFLLCLWVWREPRAVQTAFLSTYALGVLLLLPLECWLLAHD
jgi:hypothetical protein